MSFVSAANIMFDRTCLRMVIVIDIPDVKIFSQFLVLSPFFDWIVTNFIKGDVFPMIL